MIDRARWNKVRDIFGSALGADPARREEVVAQLAGEDSALRSEVLALLRAHEEHPSYLSRPAFRLLDEPDDGRQPAVPLRIGPYRVVSELGRGGMGVVFLAERDDEVFAKRVAIKVLRHGLGREARTRFSLERQALAEIDHPHIARIFDGGTLPDRRPYLVMELVEGLRIDRYCERAELSVEGRVRLVLEVCEAVCAAHRKLLVHGDLKPSNVLVAEGGATKLIDFGVAARLGASQASERLTVAYASPERMRGEAPAVADDVFSLGVVLCELLSGGSPIEQGPAALERRLPGDLGAIVAHALAPRAEDRYESVQALADDLRRSLDNRPVSARPHSLVYVAGKAARRNPLAAGLVALAPLALVGGTVARKRASARAARRSRAAHHFAGRGRELLEMRRAGALLPRAESIQHRHLVEAKARGVRKEVAAAGRDAGGEGQYALACGLVTLERHAEARRCLETALAEGFDAPEVSLLLGKTLWTLYLDEVNRAHRLATEDELRSFLEDLRRRYREPVLHHLRVAERAGGEELLYVRGLIAYSDGELDRALVLARQAVRRAPWLFEASRLEAEVHVARAKEAAGRADAGGAEKLLQAAGAAYEKALAVGRSDAQTWAGEAARRAELFAAYGARPLLEPALSVEDAIWPASIATELAPDLVGPYLSRAGIFWRWSDYLERWDRDPSHWVARAVAESEAAIRIDPDQEEACATIAKAASVAIRWESGRGAVTSSWFELGVSSAARAIELRPGWSGGHNISGNVLVAWGREKDRAGSDARPTVRNAVERYRRAVALDPGSAKLHANLAVALCDLARAELLWGCDPERWVVQALDAAREAVERNPTEMLGLGSRVMALGIRAACASASRTAPATLSSCFADYERSIRALETSCPEEEPWAALELAENRRQRAAAALRLGGDPSIWIEEGLAAVRRGRTLAPNHVLGPLNEGQLHLVRARYELERGRSPEAALARALEALDAGFSKQDASAWLALGRAEAWLLEARGKRQAGHVACDGLDRARSELRRIPESHYLHPRALALEAVVVDEEAGAERLDGHRARARDLLLRAVHLNPLAATEVLAQLRPAWLDAVKAPSS